MTKRTILSIIKEGNENKETKWTVLENTSELIAITNNYDSSIRFEIRMNQGEGKDIHVVDVNGWKESVAYFIQGTKFYCDFNELEEGIKKAVEAVVRHFYYYY